MPLSISGFTTNTKVEAVEDAVEEVDVAWANSMGSGWTTGKTLPL